MWSYRCGPVEISDRQKNFSHSMYLWFLAKEYLCFKISIHVLTYSVNIFLFPSIYGAYRIVIFTTAMLLMVDAFSRLARELTTKIVSLISKSGFFAISFISGECGFSRNWIFDFHVNVNNDEIGHVLYLSDWTKPKAYNGDVK